jgi:hypothetical protein
VVLASYYNTKCNLFSPYNGLTIVNKCAYVFYFSYLLMIFFILHRINFIIIIIMDFSLFGVCPSNKHCPSARWPYDANAVGKDVDIFAVRTVSLNHIYTRQPKIVNNICSYSECSVLCSSCYLSSSSLVCLLFCINVFFPSVLACNSSLTLCCVCP